MHGGMISRLVKHQSELSLAVAAMFFAGGLFALLVATVLPPDRPVEWYLAAAVAGIALLIGCVACALGRRLTVGWAGWITSVYLLLLILLVVRASNLNRATVAGLMLVVAIVFFAWFMPMRWARLVGYSSLSVIAVILVWRFPSNDGVLIAIALVSLTILLTEVFGGFRRNLERAALIDPLTRAWNRAGFERLLEVEIASMRRTSGSLSVMYIDLDHFKTVNDTLGHRGGDLVLQEIATAFIAGVRARDSVARLGGDEFMLILPDTDAEEAQTLAGRLQRNVLACGWSYGIAEYQPGEARDEFIDRADAEMMELKRRRHARRAS